MNAEKKKYAELASMIFSSALREGLGSNQINMIFDVYKHVSVKKADRDKRKPHPTVLSLAEIASGQ